MQMFVWQNADGVTSSYHADAGVVVIAESLEAARELLKKEVASDEAEVFTAEPDYTAKMGRGAVEKVFIFPDAGCC